MKFAVGPGNEREGEKERILFHIANKEVIDIVFEKPCEIFIDLKVCKFPCDDTNKWM